MLPKDMRTSEHNAQVRALIIESHPEWKGRVRLTKDTIGVKGLATSFWRLELGATPSEEVDHLLPALEWNL